MSRFLVIVIVLVAAALLINKYIIKNAAERPPAEKGAEEAPPEAEEPPTAAHAATPAETPVAEATSPMEPVMLGKGDLLAGIPGEGDLTLSQIEAWLGEPNNHTTLQPELPLGLVA